jgi:hypothetical protein
MTMNKTLMMAVMVGALAAGSMGSAKAQDVLTGDKKLACEAILCLAAVGQRPGECSASIAKYFRITASKPSKLKAKRKDFLNLCPTGDANLVNSLVSGKCNPEYQDCAAAGGSGGSAGGGGSTSPGRQQQQLR